MIICGIDPGLDGALAFLVDGTIAVFDMPTLRLSRNRTAKREIDAHLLADRIEEMRPMQAFVELANAMPKQGTASMFAFGKGYGVVIGVLAALQVPVSFVPPQRWKKALRVPAAKDGARARASQLMPSAACNWPLVKHDGRAEAALIAYYGALDNRGDSRPE